MQNNPTPNREKTQWLVARFKVPLDPRHPDWPETCPYATTAWSWSLERKAAVLHALVCGRWGCSYCGPRKARKLAHRVGQANPNRMLTLTVDPARWDSPRAAYDGTRRKITPLIQRLRKQCGNIEYMRVLELHKSGYPHYHLIIRSDYISHHLIKHAWADLTGATIVDVRKLHNSTHAARYTTKYLCKQTYVPWTNRRVTTSRNFFPPADHSKDGCLDLVDRLWDDCHPWLAAQIKWPGRIIRQIGSDLWMIDDLAEHEQRENSTAGVAQ